MPSSKKARGKQRKAAAAAKREAAVQRNDASAPHASLPSRAADRIAALLDGDSDHIMETIIRGDRHATEFVAYDLDGDSAFEVTLLEQLASLGVVDAVMAFLDRCQDDDHRNIIQNASNDIVLDPVDMPSAWISLLANVTDVGRIPSTGQCRLAIVERIDPLVRCMCSPSREFFKSNRHYHFALLPFMTLLSNLVADEKVAQVLFQQKGLIDFFVQAIFWETHRPDIVKEQKEALGQMSGFEHISNTSYALIGIYLRAKNQSAPDNECAKAHLQIATTPILERAHIKKETPLFVVGLVNLLRERHVFVEDVSFSVLGMLVAAECVDKDVISAVVNSMSASNYYGAVEFVKIASVMLVSVVGDGSTANDNRVAFAIDQGVLEACLRLMVHFSPVCENDLLDRLDTLFGLISAASVMMKSAKAMIRQRRRLRKEMESAELALENKSNEKCSKVLRILKQIAFLKVGIEDCYTKTCCLCGESLTVEAKRSCGECNSVFCSQNCLTQKSCCTAVPEDKTGKESRAAKTRKAVYALRRNVNATADRLMTHAVADILGQATLQEYDITECLVEIDLTGPLRVRVRLACEFLGSSVAKRLDREGNFNIHKFALEQRIQSDRAEGFLTSITYALSPLTGNMIWLAGSHRCNSRSTSWKDAQTRFKDRMDQHEWRDLSTRGLFFCNDHVWEPKCCRSS